MGSLFSKPKPPKPVELPPYVPPPEPEPVPEAPAVDDAAVREAKRRERLKQSQRSGRASTFLSDDEGGLG